jgi:hypothetical protein
MERQYCCKNPQRLEAVRDHATLNGIDYLEVLDQMAPLGHSGLRQRILIVHCVKPLPALTEENVHIAGGVRTPVAVVKAAPAADPNHPIHGIPHFAKILDNDDPHNVLVVETDSVGDFSTYRLRLVLGKSSDEPPADFDPLLSHIDFCFKVECPSEFDCAPPLVCPPQKAAEPEIDYLAKDYASFRRLMLDRLSTIMPDWKERNTADVGIALVELLAYAGDYLSYHQDAVATEAYLGTARKRVSVRRHARLIDYRIHEGCNARVWVQAKCEGGDICIEQGSQLLTRLTGTSSAHLAPNSPEYDKALAEKPAIFETMHDAILCPAHNEIEFYTWGDADCCLPKGATQATLIDNAADPLRLRPGDVLIFEEVRHPETGLAGEKNPNHRHAIRLTKVYPEAELVQADETATPHLQIKEDSPGVPQTRFDPLNNQPIVQIEWGAEDALPFCLCLRQVEDPPGSGKMYPASVASGNIILADHGKTIGEGNAGTADTPEVLDEPGDGIYRPGLKETNVTHSVLYDDAKARRQAAAKSLEQDPREALPCAAVLEENEEPWLPQHDLLDSEEFHRDFVVEMEEDRTAHLRFGDGILGEKPKSGAKLEAVYRIGNGTSGNVGAEAIAHLVTSDDGIIAVRNPLPAHGGTAPESIEEVQLYAPQAFRTQLRAVTAEDYAAAAEKHPEVQKAVATLRWTGSWHTFFITVDRKGGREVDEAFESQLRLFLDQFRLAGHDLEIEPPILVPLHIVMSVCVKPGYFRYNVKRALVDAFSSVDLPDGRRGFFHPDNLTFGQPVYLSQVISTAMQITGVNWVDLTGKSNKFQRWSRAPNHETEQGLIKVDRLEIARLDNNPSAPENGRIEFLMEGGL